MEILLEKFYNTDINLEKFHDRKQFIDANSYQIYGISKSGKTKLIKNYLLTLKKSTFLYIDCLDTRIDITALNNYLPFFCSKYKIQTLVFDNYTSQINFVNVSQLIISSEIYYGFGELLPLQLFPLDYEEFLAYEHKYDSSALNHFFQLGGLPIMHKIQADERDIYLQKTLKYVLHDIEFSILSYCSKIISQKVSTFTIYERLKQIRKISKDKAYQYFFDLKAKGYIHLLEKFNYPKATKKIYLCDVSIKNSLSVEKNFGKLFENMVFLELIKSQTLCYYDDDIDFYLPKNDEIILCKPFADERMLFKKLENIEAFLFTHSIKKITAVTMNKESTISHPLATVEMIPFDIWALGD